VVEHRAEATLRASSIEQPPVVRAGSWAATVRLLGVGRITVADRRAWWAPDAEVAALFAAARDGARSPEALAVLICARYLDSAGPDPEAAGQRDRLYEIEASRLGLRVSTAYMLLDRSDRQLDVLADDGEVTNILGLHID
jgi:hypothetical protein